MEKAVFDTLVLRTVIGTINATASPHTRKVTSVVVEKGLSAEKDNRLSESERRIVIEAIDAFESKLFNETWSQLEDDEERVTYVQSLRFFIEGCSHMRLLKNMEMCIKQLLFFMNDASVTVHATLWNVICSIFQRLQSLNGVEEARKKVASAGSEVLRKIQKMIAQENATSDESNWSEMMRVSCIILRTLGSIPKGIDALVFEALIKMKSPDSAHSARLVSSEFLALSVARTKRTHEWSQLMNALLFFLKELTDVLCGPLEEESFRWDDQFITKTNTYSLLEASGAQNATVISTVKLFAGGIDLLERLMTCRSGCFPLPQNLVLQILSRVLFLSYSDIKRRMGSPKSFEFLACFPRLQIMCWDMLALFMRECVPSILMHTRLLTRLIVQSLSDAENTLAIREALYNATAVYLSITGTYGIAKTHQAILDAVKKELVDFLEEYNSKRTNLTGDGTLKAKKKGRRQKRKLSAEHLDAEVEPFMAGHGKTVPEDACGLTESNCRIAAFQLMAVLMKEGVRIFPKDSMVRSEELLAQLCVFVSASAARPGFIPVQIALVAYEAMLNCIVGTDGATRLLSVADWTYRAGCGSHDDSIRRFCSQALTRLDPFLFRNPFESTLTCLPSWSDNCETVYFPPLIEKRTPPPELESKGASVADKEEENEDGQEMSDTQPALHRDIIQSGAQDRAPVADTSAFLSRESVLWQPSILPKVDSVQKVGNPLTESANEKTVDSPEKTGEDELCDDRMIDSEGSLPEIDSGESDDAT